MEVVDVGEWSLSRGTEVKCYQFSWKTLWALLVLEDVGICREITGHIVCTLKQTDARSSKRKQQLDLRGLESWKLICWWSQRMGTRRPQKPLSAPEHIIVYTSYVELLFGSLGVWGTESLKPHPQQLQNWSDVSLNRDKPEQICFRSELWMKPVTEFS